MVAVETPPGRPGGSGSPTQGRACTELRAVRETSGPDFREPPQDAEPAPLGVLGMTAICITLSEQVGPWARDSSVWQVERGSRPASRPLAPGAPGPAPPAGPFLRWRPGRAAVFFTFHFRVFTDLLIAV